MDNDNAYRDFYIELGKRAGINTSIYDKPEYNVDQMIEIMFGLIAGLDVTSYARPDYSAQKMNLCRLSLLKLREESQN